MSEPVDHVNDPAGHFPYKEDAARAAGLPENQIDLARRIVEAQQRVFENPGDQAAIDEHTQLMAQAQQQTQQRRENLAQAQQAAAGAQQPQQLNGGSSNG